MVSHYFITGEKNAIAKDKDHGFPPENHSVRDHNSQTDNDRSIDNAIAS